MNLGIILVHPFEKDRHLMVAEDGESILLYDGNYRCHLIAPPFQSHHLGGPGVEGFPLYGLYLHGRVETRTEREDHVRNPL